MIEFVLLWQAIETKSGSIVLYESKSEHQIDVQIRHISAPNYHYRLHNCCCCSSSSLSICLFFSFCVRLRSCMFSFSLESCVTIAGLLVMRTPVLSLYAIVAISYFQALSEHSALFFSFFFFHFNFFRHSINTQIKEANNEPNK